MMTFDEAQDEKRNIQYTCEQIAKLHPDYFIKVADELIRHISRLKAEATKLEKLDTDNDDGGVVGKTDVGNIAKFIAAYNIGRIDNDQS